MDTSETVFVIFRFLKSVKNRKPFDGFKLSSFIKNNN